MGLADMLGFQTAHENWTSKDIFDHNFNSWPEYRTTNVRKSNNVRFFNPLTI